MRLQRPLRNRIAAIHTLKSASTGGVPVKSMAADIRSAAAPRIYTGIGKRTGSTMLPDPLIIRKIACECANNAGTGETV